MNNEFNEIQKQRFQFLHTLYEAVDGDVTIFIKREPIGEYLGFDTALADKIIQYLIGERLVKLGGIGRGPIRITHKGIKEVEEARTNPHNPTKYFPSAIINVISVGQMKNSQIQQSGAGAKQTIILNEEKREEIKTLIELLGKELSKSDLIEEDLKDIVAEIQTIKAQLRSTKTKWSIIAESIQTIKTILLSAAGSAIAVKILPLIEALFAGQ